MYKYQIKNKVLLNFAQWLTKKLYWFFSIHLNTIKNPIFWKECMSTFYSLICQVYKCLSVLKAEVHPLLLFPFLIRHPKQLIDCKFGLYSYSFCNISSKHHLKNTSNNNKKLPKSLKNMSGNMIFQTRKNWAHPFLVNIPFLDFSCNGVTFKRCATSNSPWQITVICRFPSGTSCPQVVWGKNRKKEKKKWNKEKKQPGST